MLRKKPLILGVGELLWDLLPGDKCLGGAPANFIYNAAQLGSRAILLSRVGNDPLGAEALEQYSKLGMDTSNIQIDNNRKTGVVDVHIDEDGQPEYEIVENVAWDFIEFQHQIASLVRHADLIYFGSLAQRLPVTCETISKILSLADESTVKFFDVNLRVDYFTPEIIKAGLRAADIVKLNEDELKIILPMAKPSIDYKEFTASALIKEYQLEMLCVTMGSRGCELKTPNQTVIHRGYEVDVKDTVGAGDAFSAALAVSFLAGLDLERIAKHANLLGAYIASQKGATPHISQKILEQVSLDFKA